MIAAIATAMMVAIRILRATTTAAAARARALVRVRDIETDTNRQKNIRTVVRRPPLRLQPQEAQVLAVSPCRPTKVIYVTTFVIASSLVDIAGNGAELVQSA